MDSRLGLHSELEASLVAWELEASLVYVVSGSDEEAISFMI